MNSILDGHRDGETFDPAHDLKRLNKQATHIFQFMNDQRWHTLTDISRATRYPEASVSARLRDLRKIRFGASTVERRLAHNDDSGLWEYRLIPSPVVIVWEDKS